jgi:hypothetical protein
MYLHSIVMSLGGSATEEDADIIAKLFGSVGKIWRGDEKLFDAVTGLRYVAPVNIEERCCLIPCHRNFILDVLSILSKKVLG